MKKRIALLTGIMMSAALLGTNAAAEAVTEAEESAAEEAVTESATVAEAVPSEVVELGERPQS